jgi:hypothetical protein
LDLEIIGLGAITDLAGYRATSCGSVIESRLVGGSPEQRPERYRNASPIEMLPTNTKVVLYQGSLDTVIPRSQGQDYRSVGRALGSDIELITLEGVSHFDLIDPSSELFVDLVDRLKRR